MEDLYKPNSWHLLTKWREFTFQDSSDVHVNIVQTSGPGWYAAIQGKQGVSYSKLCVNSGISVQFSCQVEQWDFEIGMELSGEEMKKAVNSHYFPPYISCFAQYTRGKRKGELTNESIIPISLVGCSGDADYNFNIDIKEG